MKAIAHRFWSKSYPVLYVESVKGRKGDWGYTTDSGKALALTPEQQKRFNADCQSVGVIPVFIPV